MPCCDTMMILGFCTTSSDKWLPWLTTIATTQVLQFFHPFFHRVAITSFLSCRSGRAIVAKNSTWNLPHREKSNSMLRNSGMKGQSVPAFLFWGRYVYTYIIYVLKRSCSRHMLVKRLIDINSRRETAIQVTVTKELEDSKILQFFSSQHLPNSCYLLNQRMTPKVFMYIAMTWLRSWETSHTKMPRQAGH